MLRTYTSHNAKGEISIRVVFRDDLRLPIDNRTDLIILLLPLPQGEYGLPAFLPELDSLLQVFRVRPGFIVLAEF